MTRLCSIFGMIFLLGTSFLNAQVSPDCVNAVPICNDTPVNGGTNGFGVDDFNGAKQSGCLEETITQSIESNSAWYRFRTGASGQLGFNISTSSSEDWDFALYKAANCSELGEPIRCNFYDNQDQHSFLGVGEDPTGDSSNIQYEDWIDVAPGEDYYLLINNFSNINSGFSIQFSGNIFVTNPFDALDCSIVSNLLGPPVSACEGSNVTLNATTINAVTYNWFIDDGSGFQLLAGENSSVVDVFDSATYRVEVIRPAGNNIISDVQVGFSAMPTTFPIADSAACSELPTYDLTIKDNEAMGSQDIDEFVVSYHYTLDDANNGVNVLPKELTTPSETKTIFVRVTSVKNPDCFDTSESFRLIRVNSPVIDFPSEVYLCDGQSSVAIGSLITQPYHTYSWDTGETYSSIDVTEEGLYTLTVTNTQNGVSCSDTTTISVLVSNLPVISDIEIEDLQEESKVTILMEEEGDWEYSLDDSPFQESPVFNNVLPGMHEILVNDKRGCGSVSEQFVVVGFSKFFTPNGDGMNDYWQIVGVSNLENPLVSIYDRFGKLLVQLTENSQGWDGTLDGTILPATDYWFKLNYTDINGERNEAKYINNHFSLKR